VLARMPRMLRDIVCSAMAGEADLAMVGQSGEGEEMVELVERTRPDVVVLGLGQDGNPGECAALLRAHPLLKVLTVSANGRQLMLHDLRLHVDSLGELSPPGLLDAIRAAVSAG